MQELGSPAFALLAPAVIAGRGLDACMSGRPRVLYYKSVDAMSWREEHEEKLLMRMWGLSGLFIKWFFSLPERRRHLVIAFLVCLFFLVCAIVASFLPPDFHLAFPHRRIW